MNGQTVCIDNATGTTTSSSAPSYTPSTTTTVSSNGTTTETSVTTQPDGTRTETQTVTASDGTKTITITKSQTTSSSQTTTSSSPDGTSTTTTTTTHPDGSTSQTVLIQAPDGTKTTTQTGPSLNPNSEFCRLNPTSAACSVLGNDGSAPSVNKSSYGFALTNETNPFGTGSCPAGISVLGSQLSFDAACNAMTSIRPIVIGIGWFIAGFILIGAFKDG